MPMTEALKAFEKRITDLYEAARGQEKLRIAEIDGASSAISIAILINTYQDILRRIKSGEFDNLGSSDHSDPLAQFKQGEYYTRKESVRSTFLPSTYTDSSRSYAVKIDLDSDDPYKAFLESKSEFPDNTKRFVQFPGGNFKECKVGFRIDLWPFVPCAALVTKKINDGEMQMFLEEVELNNKLAAKDPRFFVPMSTILDQKTNKLHTYMEHVQFDLYFVVTSDMRIKGYKGSPILDRTPIKIGAYTIEAWRLDLINQMLQAIAVIHAAGICHRDLKPENILCAYDESSKRMVIKIIDFGLATKFNYFHGSLVGTHSYVPPEAFLYQVDWVKPLNEKLLMLNAFVVDEDTGEIIEDNPIQRLGIDAAIEMVKNAKSGTKLPVTTGLNQGEHDMWSLGTIFAILLEPEISLKSLKNKSKESALTSLINGLLATDPAKRLNITQAQQKMAGIMEIVAQQNPELAKSLGTIPEFKADIVKFENTGILLNFLDKFKEYLKIGNNYNEAKHEITNYIDTLLTIDDPEFRAQFNGYMTELKSVHSLDLKDLSELHKTLQDERDKIWSEEIDLKSDDGTAYTHEDDWFARIERRLLLTLVCDLTAMAIAYREDDVEAAEQIFVHMKRYAQTTAEEIESHKKRPFITRFNASG